MKMADEQGDPLREIMQSSPDWNTLNDSLKSPINTIHEKLKKDKITVAEADEELISCIVSHLVKANALVKCPLPRRKFHAKTKTATQTLCDKLKETKNRLRSTLPRNPTEFFASVRAHNRIKKLADKESATTERLLNEKKFWKNPIDFAKKVCTHSGQAQPDFPPTVCHSFFQSTYSNSEYGKLPKWVSDSLPDDTTQSPLDMSPITPKIVRKTILKCSSNSKPGNNGISYFHLKRLPSTHHLLATMYSKLLLGTQDCPKSWCMGKFILLYKDGPSNDPASFRPIALTSTIGKVFNKILAQRLETFLLENGFVNTTTQKGFLSGVNGTYEHIFTLSAIIENAKQNGLPINITFLDLRNAFGSVSHKLIADMLQLAKLPPPFINYVQNCYSLLEGFVETKFWSTPTFPIRRGIFQGDTLSPVIFLLIFSPIVNLADRLKSGGYVPYITVPNSVGLPPVNSHIYLEWNEEESDEPKGWYLCKIVEYFSDGRCRVEYPKNTEEVIALADTTWKLASGNSKKYRKPEDALPDPKLPHIRKKMKEPILLAATPHRTKAFADDLTLISKDIQEHQHILTQLDQSCAELDLHLKPQKCISYVFNGKEVKRDKVFQLTAGKTTNLSTKPTKFLGKTIGHSATTTSKGASKNCTSFSPLGWTN